MARKKTTHLPAYTPNQRGIPFKSGVWMRGIPFKSGVWMRSEEMLLGHLTFAGLDFHVVLTDLAGVLTCRERHPAFQPFVKAGLVSFAEFSSAPGAAEALARHVYAAFAPLHCPHCRYSTHIAGFMGWLRFSGCLLLHGRTMCWTANPCATAVRSANRGSACAPPVKKNSCHVVQTDTNVRHIGEAGAVSVQWGQPGQ